MLRIYVPVPQCTRTSISGIRNEAFDRVDLNLNRFKFYVIFRRASLYAGFPEPSWPKLEAASA